MKIALIDLDRTGFPNLALMKLSAWHKDKGDNVLPLNSAIESQEVDIAYASCVFPKNKGQINRYPFANLICGGTGFGSRDWLLEKVEHIKPDYSLYSAQRSYGFTSRGCIRRCPWCIVPDKEGWIQPWAEIYEFWDRSHNSLWLMDNNLLAAPNAYDTLATLIKEQVKVDFNQALDIRLVDDKIAFLLSQIRLDTFLRFSFDRIELEGKVTDGLGQLLKAGIPANKVMVFVLVGFDSSLEEDLARIELLMEYKVSPFVMKYQEANSVKARVVRDKWELQELARWVNQPHGFYKVFSFAEWLTIQKLACPAPVVNRKQLAMIEEK